MSDTINNNHQQTTPTPEGTGGEKLFTQADLDRIIGERLSRIKGTTADDETYKSLYEAAQKELEGIKAGQSRAAKEAAVRAYFEDKNIVGKSLDIAMLAVRADIDGLVLDGDKITDTTALDAMVTGTLAPLVSHTVTMGANTAHPPFNTGGGPDRLADAFKPKI